MRTSRSVIHAIELEEPDTSDGREIKGAAMRARLRAAAEEIIAEVGIEAATSIVIARRCGVSRGAMLHHYPTREDILIDTARHFWRRARDVVENVADDLGAGRSGISALVDRLYEEVFRARSMLIMLELMVAGRSDTVLGRAIAEILTDLFRSYEALGERAFASSGVPAKAAHAIIDFIVCTLRGLRVQYIVDPSDAVASSVKRSLVSAVEVMVADAAAASSVGKPAHRNGVRRRKTAMVRPKSKKQ